MRYDDTIYRLELEWFYHRGDSDCGIRSNWMPMVMAALCPGSGSYRDPNDDYRMRAVDKRRTIERALYTLSTLQQEALFSLFGPVHIPHSVVKVLGDLAGPSLCLTSPKTLIRACERQLLGKATAKDKLLFSDSRIKASLLRSESFSSYRKERLAQDQKEKST